MRPINWKDQPKAVVKDPEEWRRVIGMIRHIVETHRKTIKWVSKQIGYSGVGLYNVMSGASLPTSTKIKALEALVARLDGKQQKTVKAKENGNGSHGLFSLIEQLRADMDGVKQGQANLTEKVDRVHQLLS